MSLVAAMLGWLRGSRSGWALLVVIGGVAALAVLLAIVGQVGERRARAAQAQAAAAVRAAQADAEIKESLAVERQDSALALERARRQLEAADDGEIDAIPSAARRAYLCGVMRSQAGDRAQLPAPCRP